MAERFLAGLNTPQREAVQHVDGPLLILAGAGSGKTRVLTHRAAYLVAEAGAAPESLLCVTFTNKAAGEMGQRLRALLGPAGRGVHVSTFHSFGLQLIRSGLAPPQVDPRAVVFDDGDQRQIVHELLKGRKLSTERFPPRNVLGRIQRCKRDGVLPADLGADRMVDGDGLPIGELYAEYQKRLLDQRALDFGDLLLWPVRQLRRNEDVRTQLQARYRFLMVDEYQDTNRLQYELVRWLSAQHHNLAVVGDDDQSIYSWRGADLRNILDFEQDFPRARVVRLEQNYRSTQVILDAAWSVVRRNRERKPKRLWTDLKGGAPVGYAVLGDAHAEAHWVARGIREALARGVPPTEVAVFYRTNAQSRLLEEVLRLRGIEYRIIGATGFYDRREIKDVIAYLRLIHNPYDQVAFTRIVNVPRRGIGKTSVERVVALARERACTLPDAAAAAAETGAVTGKPAKQLAAFAGTVEVWREAAGDAGVAELTDRLLRETGYRDALASEGAEVARDRIENLDELLAAMQQFEDVSDDASVGRFLDDVALVAERDSGETEDRAVRLLTLHSAKGLEFDEVFIVGCEDGVLPHTRAFVEDTVEEERRLCYVGMTRARRRLSLTRARERRSYGSLKMNPPSRFLDEIDPELLRDVSPAGASVRFPQPPPPRRAHRGAAPGRSPEADVPYRPGMRLTHPTFGIGVVRQVERSTHGWKLKISFGGELKTILPKFVELTPP